jgi:hypothetical protein
MSQWNASVDPFFTGVCVVISGGITYVYFRQRARVRRAAAATLSAAGDADPGECAEQDAPVMRSIHEDQAVPPRTSRSGEGG